MVYYDYVGNIFVYRNDVLKNLQVLGHRIDNLHSMVQFLKVENENK